MKVFPETIRRLSNIDGGVLLDLRRGKLLRVNVVGTKVLDLLEQGNSQTQIAEKLSAEFQIALSDAEADVSEFLASLKTQGVIAGDEQGVRNQQG